MDHCNFCNRADPDPCRDHETAKTCTNFTDQMTTDKVGKVIQDMTDTVVKRLDAADEAERAMAAHRLRVICDYMDMSTEMLKKATFAARDALAALDRSGVARKG